MAAVYLVVAVGLPKAMSTLVPTRGEWVPADQDQLEAMATLVHRQDIVLPQDTAGIGLQAEWCLALCIVDTLMSHQNLHSLHKA